MNYDTWLMAEEPEYTEKDAPAYEEYDYVVDASLGTGNDGPATECCRRVFLPDTDMDGVR